MDSSDKSFSELVGLVKSWIPWRSEPPHVSRDFWMPDQSCRVCYDCDSQFTIFNRRHHCRLCGRVFCGQCTANSIPAPCVDPKTSREEWEKIRVCNYCYKQWQQGVATNGTHVPRLEICSSSSPSAASLASPKSCSTVNSSASNIGSGAHTIKQPFQRGQRGSCGVSPHQLLSMKSGSEEQGDVMLKDRNNLVAAETGDQSPNHYAYSVNRSDEEEEEFMYQYDSDSRNFSQVNDFYGPVEFDDMSNEDESHKLNLDQENTAAKSLSGSPLHHSFDSQGSGEISPLVKKGENYPCDGSEEQPSLYSSENPGPFDENDGLLWLPPEPEDEDDEKESGFFDDDDEDGDTTGEWGYLRNSSSFGSGEFRGKEKSGEEHKKAMKNVVDGHFRALVAQLLQVENLPVDDDDEENWLEIITSLSWEAATLLKPDMSKGGGMDPGGYVKVKCIASGKRWESMVIKGVVCKKNVAHRRMTSKIEKPRLLILGGALEYQRVSNLLSSFDTLLQQEMDHLKMAVAKIDVHHPDVLLVEKSVSRFAQEYLLAKDISLVLNIKRPLLERIARCAGAQIVPSIDHLSSPKLGYCEKFHVDRFFEDLGSAGQAGKKMTKTLMYFEGCPKPLGCTILLKGANGDELKKVKHVVQYGVFAAYHLALETSFLADEGATLPELPMSSPISVALPNKSSSIERSISTVPGFTLPASEKSPGPQRSESVPIPDLVSPVDSSSIHKMEMIMPSFLSNGLTTQSTKPTSNSIKLTTSFSYRPSSEKVISDSSQLFNKTDEISLQVSQQTTLENGIDDVLDKASGPEGLLVRLESNDNPEETKPTKEEFPPSPSDHQSILVSLSSRCVWKGTVCERSHLFRIKYYGSFDKPLGRFLRDDLFDQNFRCRSCDAPSEAHVHCYTHRQGTLTISVKKLTELLLPGEREGKIWMWHRCLQCPRTNGFPPATRRIVMSDAAWGLSFGKFLELSFSNHAAASRVASCGHSLHRDCLRFYGFGNMVACFRYASINVHSVYLPPSKLDFNYANQDWIQKEIYEVVDRAELLFSEVLNALSQIVDKRLGARLPESRRKIADLEEELQRQKAIFEESLQSVVKREVKDILEINRLRGRLRLQSYFWDQSLVEAASLDSNSLHNGDNKLVTNVEKLSEANVTNIPDSLVTNAKLNKGPDLEEGYDSSSTLSDVVTQETKTCQDTENGRENQPSLSAGVSFLEQSGHLENGANVSRTLSEGQLPIISNLSDTLDAAWTGENPATGVQKDNNSMLSDSVLADSSTVDMDEMEEDQNGPATGPKFKVVHLPSPVLSSKGSENMEDSVSWLGSIYGLITKNFLASDQKLNKMGEYNPVYVSSFRESELQSGARLLIPEDARQLLLHEDPKDITIIPIYDDEPTSIIAYALVSPEYRSQLKQDEGEKLNGADSMGSLSLSDSANFQSFFSVDEIGVDLYRSLGSADESILSMSGSRSSPTLDPLLYTKAFHPRILIKDEGPLGKVKYSVTCYYAKRFEALRRICCPSEIDYVRSLSRCKKWGAQGGKSNVFFAKTLDDRFIIKQVTKTELESFIKFAPEYFKYLSESINTKSPTCLAKILGIYQVTAKHLKGGKESKMDVLVMENLLFSRNVTRLYDLKGSSRSRYNPDCNGSNKVLLDQNLIEAMPTSPIFVGNKAKRLLERAVWNDTAFLASIDVMDYSLLVGVDEEKHELVLGIIDFMRQYTWDKHLETWVKASGILGGPKNASPTVISPKQYKKRFRKAMTTYFLMVPDQWFHSSIVPSKSQTDLSEENTNAANGPRGE